MAKTMVDVAKLAGTSIKSVSNYVNGYPHMSDELRERIATAIDTLGYRVNPAARSLRSGKTNNIALVIPELDQPYLSDLSQGIITLAQDLDMHVAIEVTRGTAEAELDILLGVRGPVVDGIIMQVVGLEERDIPVDRVRVPLVLLGERLSQPGADYVTMDNSAGAQMATQCLIDRGCRRIGVLGTLHDTGVDSEVRRLHGVMAAVADSGLPADIIHSIPCFKWTIGAGYRAVAESIAEGERFDGIFALNDAMALGALTALQEAGLRIPDDVAVVGFDDVDQSSYSTPKLTTIDPNREEIARLSVTMMQERMELGDEVGPPRTVTVPSRLVTRHSA